MQMIYLERAQVPAHLLGSYAGRNIRVTLTDTVSIPSTAGTWSGGTQNIYSAVRLADGARASITDTFSAPWDATRSDKRVTLKPGFAVLRTGTFCGRDAGLHFFISPTDAAPLLPAPGPELSADALVVLEVVSSLKSHAREDEYRRRGYSSGRYDARIMAARAELVAAGMLTPIGAVTPKGRNMRATARAAA